MNAQPARLIPHRSVTFEAWRNDRPARDDLSDCTCIEGVAQQLAATSPKGTVLAIVMHDAGRNKRTLALYKVRESSRRYSWRPSTNGGKPVKVGALEPLLLHALDVREFAPIEAFDALRDDPVGADLQLVEGR